MVTFVTVLCDNDQLHLLVLQSLQKAQGWSRWVLQTGLDHGRRTFTSQT